MKVSHQIKSIASPKNPNSGNWIVEFEIVKEWTKRGRDFKQDYPFLIHVTVYDGVVIATSVDCYWSCWQSGFVDKARAVAAKTVAEKLS